MLYLDQSGHLCILGEPCIRRLGWFNSGYEVGSYSRLIDFVSLNPRYDSHKEERWFHSACHPFDEHP